jgi:hypothetical protein
MLAIESGLNMMYQKADIRTSRSNFIEGETIFISEFNSSVIEDHAAIQSMESFCMLPEKNERAAALSQKKVD